MSADRLHEALDAARERRSRREAVDVDGLAASYGVSRDDLGDALLALDALEGGAADAPARPLPLPVLPDDYELGPELGRGGMGIVYRARQRSLDRQVAVKVLRPGEIVFGEALVRFQREARVLAKLRHPHIVPIHEVGESEGLVYFAMDLFEGGSLADLLANKRRPMPVARVVRLMRQVAGAVAFVHRHGMVHRDLKPANVLLDEAGDAYVADFGLAVDPSEGATLTATGGLLGTPDSMAPEQARGERALITERTDVYALGVMLYECLTGRKPFEGRTIVDKIHAVVHEEPPAPRRLVADVPAELECVCLQAMAKDPADRYATASALATDLERFEQGLPVAARGASQAARLVRSARRHRGRIIAGVVGAALAALVLHSGGFGAFGGSLEERLADAQRLEAAGELGGADLLYARAFDELRGTSLETDTERALAFGGMLAALRAHDTAPLAEQTARAPQLVEDAEWLARELDPRGMSGWALRIAAHERSGRGNAALARLRGVIGGYRVRATSDDAFTANASAELAPLVHDASNPLAGAASVALWEVWGHRPPARDDVGHGPWWPMALALAERSLSRWHDASSLDVTRTFSPEPLIEWLGPDRLHPQLEEGLLRLIERPGASDLDCGRALALLAFALDLPAPTRQVDDPLDARNKSLREFDERAYIEFARALRSTRGAALDERRRALGDAYVRIASEMAEDGREASLLIWCWFERCLGLEVRWGDAKGLSERWAAVREGDLRAPLRDALGLWADATPLEAAAHLGDDPDPQKAGWLHELLLLSVDDPSFAPAWQHATDPGADIPPDLTGSWLAFLGRDPIGGPYHAAYAVVLWPEGVGAPELVASWSEAIPSGDVVESSADFELPRGYRGIDWRGPLDATPLGSDLSPGRGRVRVRTKLRNGPRGVVAGMQARVESRAAGAVSSQAYHSNVDGDGSVAPGRTVALQEALVSWCPTIQRGMPAHRVAVLARLDSPGDEQDTAWTLTEWTASLTGELALLGGADRPDRPVADFERRRLWASQTPLTTARLVQHGEGLREQLRDALATVVTGLGRGRSSDEVRHVRAVELALGRTRTSAIQSDMDWIQGLGWDSLKLPLSGLLAGSDDAAVRATIRPDFDPEGTTLAELERIEQIHHGAAEAPPEAATLALETGRARAREVRTGRWIHILRLVVAALGALLCWKLTRGEVASTLLAGALALGVAVPPEFLMPSLGSNAMTAGPPLLVAASCWLAALAARRGWTPSAAALCVLVLACLVLAQWAPMAELWHLLASLAVLAAVLDVTARLWRTGERLMALIGAAVFGHAALPAIAVRAAETVQRHDWAAAAREALPGTGWQSQGLLVTAGLAALAVALVGSRQRPVRSGSLHGSRRPLGAVAE